MNRWVNSTLSRVRYPASFLSVSYERFVEAPEDTLDTVAQWLGLPQASSPGSSPEPGNAIATASAWQARQAVYTHSVGRWRHYAPFVPALAAIDIR